MSRALSRFVPRSLAAGLVLVLAGCGPFGYLKKVASDASRAVAEAEAAGAEEYAPYEYWGAKAYLEQSKILMGYSEYERSFDFAKRSTELADAAKERAQRVKKGGSIIKDESIAAPEDMVDAEGKKIEDISEANEREDAGVEKDGANTDSAKKDSAKKGDK